MKDDIWIEEPVFRQMLGLSLDEYRRALDTTGELDGLRLPERKYRNGKGRLRLSEVEEFMKKWRPGP
jgi:hypothetical protein